MIEGVSQLQGAKNRSPIPANLDAKQLFLQGSSIYFTEPLGAGSDDSQA
jgi:hypothetical protein